MFQTKLCGITSLADARLVVQVGGDAIGLNFFAKSPRSVDQRLASQIVADLAGAVLAVGVFVNEPVDSVVRIARSVRLDILQLHGDEPPETLAKLAERCDLPLVRAFRLTAAGLAPVFEYLDRCRQLEASPSMILLDAHKRGQYGGTGEVVDWATAAAYPRDGGTSLILAGGLTADNVAEAIQAVRPAAVDTASGVESIPGRKDAARVRRFIEEARAAFGRLEEDG